LCGLTLDIKQCEFERRKEAILVREYILQNVSIAENRPFTENWRSK